MTKEFNLPASGSRFRRLASVGLIAAGLAIMSASTAVAQATDLPPLPIIKAIAAVPQGLDLQMKYEGEASSHVGYERASTLLTFDSADLPGGGCLATPDVQNDIRGVLAESWTINSDEKYIEFKLRPGVKSSYGNEMTAEDVKWSLDRAVALASTVRFLMFDANSFAKENTFEVVDPLTLRVHYETETIFDLAVFTWSQTQILDSKKVLENATADDPWGSAWLTKNTADFGPWVVTEANFVPGSRVTFEPNPNYFDKASRGNADRLVILGIPDNSTRSQLLRSGEADFVTSLALQDYASLANDPAVRVDTCVGAVRDTILLNYGDERFGNPLVRQAVSLAIDRAAIVQAVFAGFGKPATTAIHSDFDIEGLTPYIAYDVEKAKALLAEAGYPEGFTAKFTVSQSRPGAHAVDEAIFIVDQLKRIGIQLDIEIIASGTAFSEKFFAGDYQAMLYTEGPAFADPFYSLNLMNHGKSFQNSYKYANARYDELVTEGLHLPSDAKDRRKEILVEISNLMAEDPAQIYLVDTSIPQAWNPKVTGFVNQGGVSGNISAYLLRKEP